MKPEEIELLSHYQIRTTGEPVFVIAKHPDGGFLCRRPIQSEDGIRHENYRAYAEELETHQQATDREIAQLVYREKIAVEAQQNLQNSPVPARPVIVKPN